MTHSISRRLFTTGLLLAPGVGLAAAPVLSDEDKTTVDKAVAYLQGLSRARGRFTQTDSRGKTAIGDVYLQRPGKIRFEYDAPNNNILVISDGNQVSVADSKLKTTDRYPLRSTPLSLFLAKQIRLDRGVVVTQVDRAPGKFTITARDGGKDTAGSIIITFSDEPVGLMEWTIIDAQRQRTRIQLNSLNPVASLDPELFKFAIPRTTGKGP